MESGRAGGAAAGQPPAGKEDEGAGVGRVGEEGVEEDEKLLDLVGFKDHLLIHPPQDV